ncbi:acylphosphatase [Elusimicrobiota bacterium]
MAKAKITVKGRVQMVGFRYYTVINARKLGVEGYVRNLESGDVEILARADEGAMAEFIKAVRKGPASAVITDVDIKYNTWFTENITGFDVKY